MSWKNGGGGVNGYGFGYMDMLVTAVDQEVFTLIESDL